jgi:hypothetical protein
MESTRYTITLDGSQLYRFGGTGLLPVLCWFSKPTAPDSGRFYEPICFDNTEAAQAFMARSPVFFRNAVVIPVSSAINS